MSSWTTARVAATTTRIAGRTVRLDAGFAVIDPTGAIRARFATEAQAQAALTTVTPQAIAADVANRAALDTRCEHCGITIPAGRTLCTSCNDSDNY